jgi:spore coat polysaccharide biosynthesis protein SpsF (cytidylyltransferase family)
VKLLLDQARQMPSDRSVVGEDGHRRHHPLGYLPEVVRAAALVRAAAAIPSSAPHHRAHVTSWLRTGGELAPFRPPADWPRRAEWRWTVDTREDLAMANAFVGLLGNDWPRASYAQLVQTLDAHPDVTRMNSSVKQKPLAHG